MAYQITWYLDQRIILMQFQGELTLEELPQVFDEVIELRKSGGDIVHILSDVSHMSDYPRSLVALRQLTPLLHDFGVAVVVGVKNPMLHFTLSAASQFMDLEMRTAETIEEAQAILARLDPSLAHLLP